MGSVPPTRREGSRALARRCLFAAALSALAACAGLLDLPDDPRLAEPVDPEAPGAPGAGGPQRSPVQSEDDPAPVQNGAAPSPSGEGVGGVQREPPPDPTASAGDVDPPRPPEPADAGVDDPEGHGDPDDGDPVDADPDDADPDDADPGDDVPPPDAAPADPCLEGAALGPNGRCYTTLTAELVWDDARDACQALGAGWDLATIRDAAANDFIAGLVNLEAWLGGSDAAVEGAWVWVTDNQPFWNGTGDDGAAVGGAFENWNSDEPNGGGPSDCMRLVPGRGTWADLQCSFERPALCEGPRL